MALKEGKAQSRDMQLLIVGAQNTGKSCLVRSFLGEKFIEGQAATDGVDVDVAKIYCKNWIKIDQSEKTVHLRHQFISQYMSNAKRQKPKLSKPVEKLPSTIVPTSSEVTTPAKERTSKLPEPHPQDIQEATKEVTAYDTNTLNVTIWDFGGQVIFHNTHAVFISQNGVIVITFDASMDLTDEVAPREGSPKPSECRTVISNIQYWLQVVDSMCSVKGGEEDLSPFLPVAILAGTHIDKLHPDIKNARKLAKKKIIPQLKKQLLGKSYTRHLAGIKKGIEAALEEYCFFISNKNRDEEIERLQNATIDAATSLKKEQPIRFLKIERQLLMHTEHVITKSMMLDIVAASTFSVAKDSSEFQDILNYFHSKRSILYFKTVKSLLDRIFLSPRWLAKLFSYVITAHSYKEGVDHTLDHSWKLLSEYGILHERLVSYMVDKFHKDYPGVTVVTTEQVVDILLCFHLVAEITREAWFTEKEYPSMPKSGKTFIVPSLVPRDDMKDIPNTIKERIVHFKFPDEFVPTSVLNQIIANCICYNVRKNRELLWMRHGKVALQLGDHQKYYLSWCEEKQSIRLTITVVGNDLSSVQERKELVNDVTKMLKDVMTVFMPAADTPVLLVPCQLCPNLHITFTKVCTGGTVYCPSHKDKTLPTGYYSDFTESGCLLLPSSRCTQLPDEVLEKKPSMRNLNKIVIPRIKAEWKNVVYSMDYELHIITAIERESQDLQERFQKLFTDWLTTSHGPTPKTWKTLLERIEDVEELTAAVEHVKEALLEALLPAAATKK